MVLIIVYMSIFEMNPINICEHIKLCFMEIVYTNIINYNFINCSMCLYTYLVHKFIKRRFENIYKSCKNIWYESSFFTGKLSYVVLNVLFKTFLFPFWMLYKSKQKKTYIFSNDLKNQTKKPNLKNKNTNLSD